MIQNKESLMDQKISKSALDHIKRKRFWRKLRKYLKSALCIIGIAFAIGCVGHVEIVVDEYIAFKRQMIFAIIFILSSFAIGWIWD